MKVFDINVAVKAIVNYQYKYDGELLEHQIENILKAKYKGNLWLALKDDFIQDIDCEIVENIL